MLKTVEQICERLVKSLDPESVILFGSRARGVGNVSSDVDLLIVKETNERPIDRRVSAEKALLDRAIPLDIFVYTPQEILFLYSIGSPFIEEVLETGRVLYMRKATEQWMRDSEEELISAEILLTNSRYRAACFHSQQCVEKCLKALILEKGEMPEKTHDILDLLAHANNLGWKTGLSLDDAIFLNSIYKGRYPSEEGLLPHGEPTEQDARRACESARRSLEASRQSLS